MRSMSGKKTVESRPDNVERRCRECKEKDKPTSLKAPGSRKAMGTNVYFDYYMLDFVTTGREAHIGVCWGGPVRGSKGCKGPLLV